VLKALLDYGNGLDSEPGFKTREVRWCIELSAEGRFLNVLPLGDGKRGGMHPRCPDMHGMNAGGKSHFLVETAETAVLLFKANEKPREIAKANDKHAFFVDMLQCASKSVPILAPLAKTLGEETRLAEIREALAQHKAKPSDCVGWRVGGIDPREDAGVQEWWRAWRRQDIGGGSPDLAPSSSSVANEAMLCYLTGLSVQPLLTHSKITGLFGDGKFRMGDVMVGFDKAAFGSYGLGQSANAAVSAEAAQQYVDGLNHLIRHHSRTLANSQVVHWFKERVAPQDNPLEWLISFESEEQTAIAAQAAASRLLDSIRSGERARLGENHYYALTLSGGSGRVMVRDWMQGQFEDLVCNVEAWFTDLAIVAPHGNGLARNPKFHQVCLALVINDRKKLPSENLKKLPASFAATLWKSAVQNLPIPQPVMAQALAQFRAERFKPDERGREVFNHSQMGLIRAYFVRLQPGGNNAMTPYLNSDHPDPAYHCGRLLAVLANLQRAAMGDVGAGVVQRYYPSASQTPGLILGRLVSNARNHLGKLEGGLAFWYESRIAEVMGHLNDRIPRILNLEGQGLFALGYYQQLAALRAGKKSDESQESKTGELQ
jgi:CRISPR-associated protein Csd1